MLVQAMWECPKFRICLIMEPVKKEESDIIQIVKHKSETAPPSLIKKEI